MNENKIKSIIRKNEFAVKNKKRKCFLPECESYCIGSHLLQKNGILNRIAPDRQLYELAIDPFREQIFYFNKRGINEALTFPGFCNEHDTNIFKDIETGNIDFENYRTKLLFSYRILANEIRKKEILIDWFTKNLKDPTLRKYLYSDYFRELQYSIQGFKAALEDGAYYLNYFYSDMNNNTESFTFYTIEIPFIEICASGVFTYETSQEIELLAESQRLTDIYFNLLPLENKSIIILGFLTECFEKCGKYIENFKLGDSNNILKKTSDILLTNLENWLCSENVMKKLKINERDIVRLIHESINSSNERRTLNFNLFNYMK